ncbi:MAG: hypothetical protein JWR33_665 [Naasia sp.]|jgi:D-methionine transport system substrate-binding protein|uniref:MetQ/NlpA family ABC transporter substrate-binding protein n=1 Tax=Naasia sp. TaxID=2546198 RepID=UPI00261C383F|nr:MetQ/NlpA family ABC transporter substrate-binding protein [Naasia sp.]MCU1569924.1 hypothetical protein [Naasia sp.]
MSIDTSAPSSAQPAERGFELRKRRRWPWIVAALVVVALVAGFFVVRALQSGGANAAAGDHFGRDLKVAFLSTDAAQEAFLQFIADDIASDYDITVEPVGVGDPNQLHAAVSDGEIAATIYAHAPWIEQANAANGWTLEPTEPVFQWAYSLWSSQYGSFDELPDGANIAILDDPANTAQALLLLANDGQITLDPGVDAAKATLDDIAENPRELHFTPIAFGTAARTLDDFDGIISYNFEFAAADIPAEYKIYAPEAPLVFASQLAISQPYVDEASVKDLIAAFADPRVEDFLATTEDPAVKGQLAPVSGR